jgi:hypothetical protein
MILLPKPLSRLPLAPLGHGVPERGEAQTLHKQSIDWKPTGSLPFYELQLNRTIRFCHLRRGLKPPPILAKPRRAGLKPL